MPIGTVGLTLRVRLTDIPYHAEREAHGLRYGAKRRFLFRVHAINGVSDLEGILSARFPGFVSRSLVLIGERDPMFKKVFLGLAALLVVLFAGFAVVVALQPSSFRVVRSTTIAAAPADVFAQVNDFHNWETWSPWAKLDPAAKNTFEGPSSGTGAIFAWAGNDKVGEGRMTILEARPGELIKIKLEFIKPFESHCITEFTFKPEGDQTAVTWTMSGENNFIGKAFCLFMDMDKTVGGDFEKGLAQMKAAAERTAKK